MNTIKDLLDTIKEAFDKQANGSLMFSESEKDKLKTEKHALEKESYDLPPRSSNFETVSE